eukprot:TRINITY_DN12283_c0_g1_i1.p1 TRINITY_DN12283_c0_g1~~TRINITY_DN12283_c0_g1_i1.p1  ORF type:complete len:382 (-),score=44.23 TRINITY_DN12283_c0_g1_i1:134-1123(-)
MVGGLVLSLGNLSTQYALAYVGLSVTEVVSASITVVVGTTLNYFLDDRINRAEILFPGVGCFLIAICIGFALHTSNGADNMRKLQEASLQDRQKEKSVTIESGLAQKSMTYDSSGETQYIERSTATKSVKAGVGTAEFLREVEEKRSIKVMGKNIYLGMTLVFFAGICFSLFSPAFNLATNDQWHALKDGVPHLVVYTAFFYFSIMCFTVAVILNLTFLYRPVLGLPKSSFTAYLRDWRGRQWALLAGFLCGFGNGFQFMGGQAAGYAAADAVQALPLVSTFWGILLFGEYRRSSRKTYLLLGGMLFMFVVAVAVLMASAGTRKNTSES